jgi:hypothetical protein
MVQGRLMPAVYRWTLNAAALVWAVLAVFGAEDRSTFVVYVATAAALVWAAFRPHNRRASVAAAFCSVLAGLVRAVLLINLQLIGTEGLPAVGALSWLFLAFIGAALASFGWVHEGPE